MERILTKATILIGSVIGGVVVIAAAMLTGLVTLPLMPIILLGNCLKPVPDVEEYTAPAAPSGVFPN
jgi:hypothetical protein